MWRIARAIVQNGSVVLFIILQSLCLFWVVKYNQVQQKIYLHSYQLMAGRIQSSYKNMIAYFNLRERYDSLANEHARFLSQQINKPVFSANNMDSMQLPIVQEDSNNTIIYKLTPAKVINNSLDKRNNMITLDKGGRHGIQPGMAVITSKGIVGIVTDTSANYSLVISLLHSSTSISAKLKRNRFFGSLVWKGKDPTIMNLEAIQKYADVHLGDTVVTSGFSIVFPKNLMIGVVDAYKVEEGSFTYRIHVKLTQSMVNLEQVYVVSSNDNGEKNQLEKKMLKYE